MKHLQWLVTFAFVLAGILLLCGPSHAAPITAGAAFTPTRFTVVDQGTVGKPDMILIPGLSSSREVWSAEAVKLAPNYRLHLLQINGFAGAPAGPNASGPMLAPIVEELHAYIVAGKMHPVVMGHSLGGLLTLMLAEAHPEDAAKLIVVDALPFYGLLFSPSATVDMVRPQADIAGQQIIAMPADQFAAMQPMMMKTLVSDPAGLNAVIAASTATDRTVMAHAMVEDLTTDVRPGLAAVHVPALVLYEYDAKLTQPDPKAYEQTMKDSYKSMPNVKLVRVDDSRHFIMYDQPVKFDAAVEGFLTGK